MKIAIICPYDYNSPGGVQTHIKDLANILEENGHYVKIIAPGKCGESSFASNIIFVGTSKRICFNKTEFDITIAWGEELKKLKKLLEDEQFDVIHFHTVWALFISFQILHKSNCANVTTFHDTPPDTWSGKLTKIFYLQLSRILDKSLHEVIVVSRAPLGNFSKQLRQRLHIIPTFTDLSRYSPNNKPIEKYNDGKFNILYLGRLEQRKGIFILLEAFNKLLNDNGEVRLLIGGTGYLQQDIESFILKNSISNVEMLGYISNHDKSAYYASCDLFCSPALYGESFGIVLVEAMASGKPVVAVANAGYSLLLQEKREYCLAEPNNIPDLYLKLKSLIENQELRNMLGSWGVMEAKKYDINNHIEKILKIYNSAITKHQNNIN